MKKFPAKTSKEIAGYLQILLLLEPDFILPLEQI